jgi:hypothetical protein
MPYWTASAHCLNVRRSGGIGGNNAGLFGEGEIGIAGSVGGLHGAVAGERGGDAEFLLSPIDARNLQNYKTGNFVCGSSGRRNELRPSPAYLTLPGGQASRLQEPSFRIWSCHVG